MNILEELYTCACNARTHMNTITVILHITIKLSIFDGVLIYVVINCNVYTLIINDATPNAQWFLKRTFRTYSYDFTKRCSQFILMTLFIF